MSIPTPVALVYSCNNEIIIQPEPVPKSANLSLVFFSGKYFIIFSIINSVSGLGINVSFVTLKSSFQNDCFPIIYAIGSPSNLLLISLK